MEKYAIIENFLALCAIPHKSHHEDQISKYLYDWAIGKGLEAHRDEAGNVIIDKPGSKGFENAPTTILQGHMDMVVVWEEGKSFDPLKDAITVIDDGESLRALGTSLGGDDGAGVAIAMTILEDPEAVHGPIRAIFTVDEEDGMSGAEALDPKYTQGEYLINLDWEGFGSLCCSSAGSDMYRLRRVPEWSPVVDGVAFEISVRGLTGGHSGAEIHLGRTNAIRTVAGMVLAAQRAGAHTGLMSFAGGSAHNAIPTSAVATVAVPKEDAALFLSVADTEGMIRRSAALPTDPHAEITVKPLEEAPEMAVSEEDTRAFFTALTAVHNGVNTMSPTIPGLVESSASTGLASLSEEYMEFVIHQRSSEPALSLEMRESFAAVGKEQGFSMELLSSGAPWPVRPGSRLVEICREQFKTLTGKDIRVEPVHAGLECGCLSKKNPRLDIISIGPDIFDIHTTREKLIIETVYQSDDLIRGILKEIAGK